MQSWQKEGNDKYHNEINKIENNREKPMKMTCFFENINKTSKPLANMTNFEKKTQLKRIKVEALLPTLQTKNKRIL